MTFEQIRKLVDVLVDDYYNSHFGEDKPVMELTLHEASINRLQEDITKSFPDANQYISTVNLPVGVLKQINLNGFVINIKKLETKKVEVPVTTKPVIKKVTENKLKEVKK